MLVAAVNSFARVHNPWEWSVYIVIHRQTALSYHNTSVWVDMQDASSWDWNPFNFMLDLVSMYISEVILILTGLLVGAAEYAVCISVDG